MGEPPDKSSILRAIDLLDANRLATQLKHFSTQYGQTDRRAVASLWSKWHFSALISTTLASNLLLEHDLPIGLDEVSIEIGSEGQTRRLWITDTGQQLASQNAFTRFSNLIDNHLVPLIQALADYSGASPKSSGATPATFLNTLPKRCKLTLWRIPVQLSPQENCLPVAIFKMVVATLFSSR